MHSVKTLKELDIRPPTKLKQEMKLLGALRWIALIFLPPILLSACSILQKEIRRGNGEIAERTRTVGSFARLKSEGPIDIILSPDNGPLKLEGDSNLLPYIETQVKGQELNIELKERVRTASPLKITVPARDLGRIEHKGTGDLRSKGKLQWGQAAISMEGAGDLEIHVSAKQLHYESEGGGSAHFEGTAERFKVENEGAGDVEALDFMASRVECYKEGSGDVKVDAVLKLIVESEGSGDLIYKKDPPNIDVRTEGSGDVHQAGQK